MKWETMKDKRESNGGIMGIIDLHDSFLVQSDRACARPRICLIQVLTMEKENYLFIGECVLYVYCNTVYILYYSGS
jgi:hypothetical protein